MRNNEQGRSMIEMLGVLAIVGVLSVGGIAGYSKAMNKFKANKLIDQITMISTNVKTIFSGQRTYNGLNLVIAGKVGILPAETFAANQVSSLTSASVTHAFTGNIDLKPAGLNIASDEGAYMLTITKIPSDACVAVLTTDFGSDATVAYGTATVANVFQGDAGTINSIATPGGSTQSMPFSVVAAKTACSNATSNTIYFKFK